MHLDILHGFLASLLATSLLMVGAQAQQSSPSAILFENVRIFNGKDLTLSPPSNVLVRGKFIERISTTPIQVDRTTTRVIPGGGRTLMPGLIDAHTHLMLSTFPAELMLTSDLTFLTIGAVRAAEDMLMRGFTTARDCGGPVYGLKRAIDMGLIKGPRIYPSGAMISQSGGHGDFRLPNQIPSSCCELGTFERYNVSVLADSPDEVRKRAREQLALGAVQVKVHAGGGVATLYDPIDATQYTVPEIRAAVEAAENWGTYVTVHAYTPRAVRQAIEAGVKCIEHGQLLDEDTVKLMAERGIWWSLQPFLDDEDANRYPEGTPNRAKQLEVSQGTERAFELAKKYGVKTAWGTDALFSAQVAALQNKKLAKMARWYTPAEVLRMATSQNAELCALTGPRNPYPGKLGVVEEGAYADLILVDGDPLANIQLIADPHKNFLIIMKDGVIYKDTAPRP